MLFLSSYEGLSFNLFPGFVISLVEFLVPRKLFVSVYQSIGIEAHFHFYLLALIFLTNKI